MTEFEKQCDQLRQQGFNVVLHRQPDGWLAMLYTKKLRRPPAGLGLTMVVALEKALADRDTLLADPKWKS